MSDEEPPAEAAVDNQPVTLKGEIVDMSKKFWSEGWGFGKIRVKSRQDPVRITGILEGFSIGQLVTVTGKFHEGKYGNELKIESIVEEEPEGRRGVQQWMMLRIPQIGPARAEEIARIFGDSIWRVLDTEPYRLTEVTGLTKERVDDIIEAWRVYKQEREKLVPFYDSGLSHREAKAAEREGITPEQIVRDPFCLYLGISGMTFARNDIIAAKINPAKDSPSRLVSAALQVVKDAAMDGHTAAQESYIIEHASALAEVSRKRARDGLDAALDFDLLAISDFEGMIMLQKYARAEAGIAGKIIQLLERNNGRDHTGPDAGGSGPDDAGRVGGSGDGWAGNGEEHDPAHVPGEGADELPGGALRPDWEGGEEDR